MKTLFRHLAAAALLFGACLNPASAQTPDVIQFAADTVEVWEAALRDAGVPLEVRLGSAEAGRSFRVTVTGGTATKGADFQIREDAISGSPFYSLNWLYDENGAFQGRGLALQAMDDGIHEPDETIELTLSDPGPNTVLGPRTKTVVTLRNSPPTFVVWPSGVEERFGGSVAQITVERRGDREPVVGVDVRVDEANPPMNPDQFSATRGVDFIPVSQRLQFASGETNKVVEVPILDDGEPEWNEFFRVTLSQPSPGAVIKQGSDDCFIRDNEVSALYDVTKAKRKAEPLVLLANQDLGPDDWMGLPAWFKLPEGGYLISLGQGDGFTHIDGLARPNLARLLPDGNVDESFVPPLGFEEEFGDAVWRENVLPLRSWRLLLSLQSGLLRLNRDGSRDQSFRPPTEPRLLPFAELEDGSVFVTADPNRILRLDSGGAIVESIVIKEHNGGWWDRNLIMTQWLPIPAPGRFLIPGNGGSPNTTFRVFRDGTIDAEFIPFEGPPRLTLSDGRMVAGSWAGEIRNPDGSLDRAWHAPRLAPGHNGVFIWPKIAEQHGKLWIEKNVFCCLNGLEVDRQSDLGFHLSTADVPATALQIGRVADSPGPEDGEPTLTIGFRRLGSTTGSATVHYTTRGPSGILTFAPLEVMKTITVPVVLDRNEVQEVVVIAAEGFEALPPPLRLAGGPAPRLNRVKRLRDGRVLLGGTGPQDTTKLESSTDLQTWHPLTDLLGGFNGPDAIWLDPSATNTPTRYYRAVAP